MAAPAITVDTYPASHRAGLKILLGSGAVGLVAAVFLPVENWGFGFPVVAFALFAGSLLVKRQTGAVTDAKASFLWVGVLLFSLLVAWRDAPGLRFLNLAMVFLFAGILAIRAHSGKVSRGSVYDYPFRAFAAWAVAFVDTFNLLLNDIVWKLLPSSRGGAKHAAAVARGLLLATPLLLIFGALFASADARFEQMFTGSIRLDGEVIVEQTMMGFGVAWLVAGLFRRMYSPPKPPVPPSALVTPKAPSYIGGMELGIVLGSLNVLFLLFVSTQWRYFFGGAEVVRATAGLGVAEFARRGFFELVGVAGLALPTLLGLHALVDPEKRRSQQLYQTLASILVVQLTVVIHSAWLKMQLYMGSFGLSTQRIYVAATLVWLALVFLWFTLTILNRRSNLFAWGGLLAMAGTVVGLNFVNPDRFVADWNIRHQSAAQVDWVYLSGLSADAAPALARAWDTIPQDQRPSVARSLVANDELRLDWRSANLSLLNRGDLLGKNRAEMKALAEAAAQEPRYYD